MQAIGARLRDLRTRGASTWEVVEHLRPHLRSEFLRSLAGSVLSVMAGFLALASTLLVASLLNVIRGTETVTHGQPFDAKKLLDLNTAGQHVLDAVLRVWGPGATTSQIIQRVGLLLLAFALLAILCNVGSRWLWISVRTRIILRMQLQLFEHILNLPMSFHVRRRAGDVLSRLHTDVGGVAEMFPIVFRTLLRSPLVMAGFFVLMVHTSAKLTAVTMAAAALYIGGTGLLGGLVRRSYQKQSRSHADLLSLAQEALLSIRVVKAFCTEKYEIHRMKAKLQDLIKEQVRGDLLSSQVPTALTQVMGIGAIILVALSGLRAVTAGELTQQGLVMFLVASVGMLATTAIAAQAMISIYILSACAGRVVEMLHLKPTITDGWRDVAGLEREIVFSNVQFSYGEGPVLRDINLKIRKGEAIGLVGPSGAGKSTLTDLLVRFYDPTGGVIELDGCDIREFRQDAFRRLFGIVSQETLLFNDTVRNNIIYGRPGVSDDDVVRAARAAEAHDFIMELPNGYNTLVGERGVRLSGGQRQRIAIARAIVGKPQVLIFDEATSSLDNESERLVQAAISDVIKNCTAIVVAHRLSTVLMADRIVVLDNGSIVEEGSHVELLERGGLYRRLWELQSRSSWTPDPSGSVQAID